MVVVVVLLLCGLRCGQGRTTEGGGLPIVGRRGETKRGEAGMEGGNAH